MSVATPANSWTVPSHGRKGGILLHSSFNTQIFNPGRSNGSSFASQPVHIQQASPNTTAPSVSEPFGSSPSSSKVSASFPSSVKPKISFAPLPNPRHSRSLSTGDSIYTDSERFSGEFGNDNPVFEEDDGVSQPDGSTDDDADIYKRSVRSSYGSGLTDEDDDEGNGRRRSSILGSSWKGTRNLFKPKNTVPRTASMESDSSGGKSLDLARTLSNLTRRTSHEPSTQLSEKSSRLLASLSPSNTGEPLSRSISASAATSSPSKFDHQRRASSNVLELPERNTLSTSPRSSVAGSRMLNGKIYGVAGMNLAKKVDEEARKGPEFVEWGGRSDMGNNNYNRDEDDDGSGMGWVRRRRLEREREEQEQERQRAATQTNSSIEDSIDPLAPSPNIEFSPPSAPATPLDTPLQQVVGLPSPSTSTPDGQRMTPILESKVSTPAFTPRPSRTGSTLDMHKIQAITIPGKGHASSTVADEKGSKHSAVGAMPITGAAGNVRSSLSDEIESEDEEEDGEDDNDDDDDDDDEDEDALAEEARTTALCAGVEVLSRHKSIGQ
ncbi:hypothetical protein [Phaffia rhodozyma]|uniref:Uncharacterized protein n=1 Tax=Phaffia rhodozyma TaxID=264483 RepID=A0A0F7SVR7_PHARH|nr:hypothetical protein [Phaffia rhodozyma]